MGKIIDHRYELALVERLAIDQMQRALSQKNHPFRNLAFSTAGEGGPNTRMVVLRKVSVRPFCVNIYTDARSGKISELQFQPKAALLFWHPTARLQVKLIADVQIHTQDETSLWAWQSLSELGRLAYNSIEAPGSDVSSTHWQPSDVTSPLVSQHFTVIDCMVREMDVLQLCREGHVRASFKYDNGELHSAAFVHP